jgi:nitroreductase
LYVDRREAFRALLEARRSVRGFQTRPVDRETIREVLRDASRAPSNCNTQPWEVHVVSGSVLKRLSAALVEEFYAGRRQPDFPFEVDAYSGRLGERRVEQGAILYAAHGVARGDAEGRQRTSARNLEFYGAPHAAFLFMPGYSDNDVRVAGDLGMFAQTLLLSLTARGLGSIPQTMLSLYPGVVRDALGMPEDSKLLLGISFGYVDGDNPANDTDLPRDSDSFFFFHDE